MARMSLPPGFRFYPTDVELVMYYLKRKTLGKKLLFEAIAEVNVYKYSPWDLPDKSCLKNKDLEWFFFCPVARKYASGARSNRVTETGYWKSTGKDRTVMNNGKTVGMVKTLVFHQGHAPKGERTDWVMHEYRILDEGLADARVDQAYVVLKLFKKTGPGPKNGAQYGAPFNEEEWDTDNDNEDGISAQTLQPSEILPLPAVANHTGSGITSTFVYGSTSTAAPLSHEYNSPFSASPPQSENLSLAVAPNNCNTVHMSSSTLSVPLSESMSLPTVAHNSSVGSLPESGPSTIMSPSNDVAQSVGEVDFDSLLATLLEDDLPSGPFGSNDVNQFNGEAFMELDDIYAGLDDLTDLEEL